MAQLTAVRALQHGLVAQNAGKLAEAERFYRAILEAQPAEPANDDQRSLIAQTYSYLGIVYRDKGDLKSYIDCFRQAARIKPNNVDTLNNLGAALQYNGELDAAVEVFNLALKIDDRCVEIYNNMGSSLQGRGDSDAAIACFKKAIEIKPDYENAYNNLGHALHTKGDLEGAIDCYRSALKIAPDSAQAHNNLGNVFRDVGKYEEAIEHFDFITALAVDPSTAQFWFNSKSQALECLYILGRYDELMERLNLLAKSGDINLREAAVSAFVTNQLKLKDPYPFCKKPLDFFHAGNLSNYISDVDSFADELIKEAANVAQVWEPQHGVTKSGFQTSPTIFQTGKNTAALEEILRKEIEAYYSKFKLEDCVYMNQWPREYFLRGWFVRLVKNGYQEPHNHPSGWLSGVVYLKTVDDADNDEGAIELGLHGHSLPILHENFARIVHRPKKGDIILFPSSVFHRTIPFSEDTDRCVMAFDLYRYSQ